MDFKTLAAKIKKQPAGETGPGRRTVKRKITPVTHDLFILASQEIEQKDIVGFIRGQADMVLNTNDYYSCHTYDKTSGILIYYIAASPSYDHGRFCSFAPAIANPGVYVLRHGLKYFVVEHREDGVLTCDVHYEHHVGINLDEVEGLYDNVPDTLKLVWSMRKTNYNIAAFAAVLLVLSIALWLNNVRAYEQLSVRAAELAAPKASIKKSGLPDVAEVIKQAALRIKEDGLITKVNFEENKLLFKVKMVSEDAARDFVVKNGGDYVDGHVVFGFEIQSVK